jgi:DNA-binding PadR family transcriptional regulator
MKPIAMKPKEVARLVLDSAEIKIDRSSKLWQVAGQDVRTPILETWKKLGYIKSDRDRLELYKEYYKLTQEGKESLTRIYFPKQSSSSLL